MDEILNSVIRIGLAEKVTFIQKHKRTVGQNHGVNLISASE